jgi:acetyl-CoA C-acetyltransferase
MQNQNTDPVVIVSIARTPMGNFQGSLKDVTAPQLGAVVIKAAIERSNLALTDPEAVIMGCVLSAGLGQAPARQAALNAKLPTSVSCTTINKMCGSGMQSVMFAHDLLKAGTFDIIVAGGMESMTNAPYLLPKARAGYRMGHQEVIDHMFYDGLEDAYQKGNLMGVFAENCAQKYHFSRDAQDQYALTSLQRAQLASTDGTFAAEIVPVVLSNDQTITLDDGPEFAKPEKISKLRPAFRKDGTVTAANSSSISDGAAALVLMRLSTAEQRGITPIAKIIAHSTHSQQPDWFTTAPVYAIEKLLKKIHWSVADVDLFEINEAFAVVVMVALQELHLPLNKINIHGGACALGHPIGASGARILVTLINALQKHHLKRGIAAICIGGGEATALAVELM